MAFGLGSITTSLSLALSQVRPLWGDEELTLQAARLPWSRFVDLISQTDAVHAFYYILVRALFLVIPESLFSLRLLSAVFVGFTAMAVFLIAKRWMSVKSAVLAWLIFSIMPITTRYGTEGRAGSLMLVLATWSTWAVMKLTLESNRRIRWQGSYVALLTATIYANSIAFLIAGPHLIAATVFGRARKRILRIVVSQLMALALGIFVIAALFVQRDTMGSYEVLEQPGLKHLVQTFSLPFGHRDRPATLAMAIFAWATILWGSTIAIRTGKVRMDDESGYFFSLIWSWALLPGLLLLSISLFHPIFSSRYILFSVPAVALLLSWSITQFRSAVVRLALVSVLLVLGVLAFQGALINHDGPCVLEQLRGVQLLVWANCGPF
jgi:mannosyltransferase